METRGRNGASKADAADGEPFEFLDGLGAWLPSLVARCLQYRDLLPPELTKALQLRQSGIDEANNSYKALFTADSNAKTFIPTTPALRALVSVLFATFDVHERVVEAVAAASSSAARAAERRLATLDDHSEHADFLRTAIATLESAVNRSVALESHIAGYDDGRCQIVMALVEARRRDALAREILVRRAGAVRFDA